MDVSQLTDCVRESLVQLTTDGECLKTVMERGEGDTPGTKANCKFRYRARYMDDSPVDSERPDWQDYTLRLGKKFKLEAWELCLATMRTGEVARVICSPARGAKQYIDIQSGDLKQEIKAEMAAGQLECGGGDAAYCGSCIGCQGGIEMMKRHGRMVQTDKVLLGISYCPAPSSATA
jgi:hypothetical protein